MVSANECLFCRIARGEIPAKRVYEDAGCIAFLDINPRNPGHTLVVPRRHAETLFDIADGEVAGFFAAVKKVALLVKSGTQAQGVSLTMSNGTAAGQVVAHAHMHVIPRFTTEGPPGLESILSVKKMDEQTLEKVAAAIKAGKGGAHGGHDSHEGHGSGHEGHGGARGAARSEEPDIDLDEE